MGFDLQGTRPHHGLPCSGVGRFGVRVPQDPDPAPLLPRYDLLVWDDAVKRIGMTEIPCNWLQIVENSLDPVHVEWLHGRYMDYVYERNGTPLPYRRPSRATRGSASISSSTGDPRFAAG